MISRGSLLQTARRRYLVIGLSVYLFELCVIVAAQFLGAGNLTAVGLAFWLGLLVSFGLQKVVSFGDKRRHRQLLVTQLLAFSLLVLWNFGFTLLITALLSDLVPPVITRTLALGITTIWNFYIYKTYLFVPRKQQARRQAAWQKYLLKPRFGRYYLIVSSLLLAATTIFWSLLGAHLQQGNADQLVNAYLQQDGATFSQAALPEQHSFLLKWPLFYLVKLAGFAPLAFITVTLLTTLITVAGLVYVLSRIERRTLMLGTWCLMLASVLLMVPAQPYPGGLLPVNMAMIATRNIEYLVYIAALVCLVKAASWRTRQFAAAVVLLGLLIATDKLFLSISIVSSIAAIVIYLVLRQREWQLLARRWLVASLSAGTLGVLLLYGINGAGIVHIIGAAAAGPYSLAADGKTVLLGSMYAFLGLLTNFGANPAYEALSLPALPGQALRQLSSVGGVALVTNLAIFLSFMLVGAKILWHSMRRNSMPRAHSVAAEKLSVLLLWSSLVILGLFIVTDHYYPVDARYLTLWLFTLFIAFATYMRRQPPAPKLLVVIIPILLLSITSGIASSLQTFHRQQHALTAIDRRNAAVTQAVAHHPVDVLIGDYWRVLPVKATSGTRQQQVLPLTTCTQPRDVLTSRAWQPDLRRHSFAYLLSFDKGLTDFPQCSLAQVINTYGLPDSSVATAGSLNNPQELVLFYDHGMHASPAVVSSGAELSTILPVALGEIGNTNCQQSTIVNVTAHQDDDLLFMSPDLLQDIAAGNCVRSIYLTAGDAGADKPYWLSREQGSEAAYAAMAAIGGTWTHRNVLLPTGQFVSLARPTNNDKISLIFMHLPDGNIGGEGFQSSLNLSLEQLETGKIKQLRTVDNQSAYSSAQLVTGLAALFTTYQPSEIRTQSSYASSQYPDHSDHRAAGRFVSRAYAKYRSHKGVPAIPIKYYFGYGVHDFDPNVDDLDLVSKTAAFKAYAQFDGGVCGYVEACAEDSAYEIYLQRQYSSSY